MRPLDKRLLRHARATRRFLAATVAVGLASTVCVLAQASLLAAVVSRAFLGHARLGDLRPEMIGLLGVVVLRALLAWAGEVAAHRGAAAAVSQLRAAVVERAAHDAAGRDAEHTGELATLATTGLDALDAYFSRYLPQLVLAVVAPLAVVVWVAGRDRMAAAILAITLPLIPLFLALVGLAARHRADARLRTLSTLGAHFLDVVQGLPTLRAFRRGRAQVATISDVGDRFRHETMSTLRVAFMSALVLELLATLGTALVAVAVGLRLAHGGLDFQTALTVLILAPEAYLPIRNAGAQFHASADGVAAAQRVLDIIEAGSTPSSTPQARAALTGAWAIRLEGVSVRDSDRPQPALDGVDLEIRAGERLAIVGPSGSGKSTLLSVLLGFTPPAAGRVVIEPAEGVPVALSDLDPAAWRAQLAWVPQQPRLFAGTIADNVRLGRPGADDATVRQALEAAGLDKVVARLPGGLDALVGEGGGRLSAGERQRVALARAFLRDAPLVLLDEPTASLDPASEAAIEEALAELARTRTVVVVAHRLRLAQAADRVVVLDGGRVARPGSALAVPDAGEAA